MLWLTWDHLLIGLDLINKVEKNLMEGGQTSPWETPLDEPILFNRKNLVCCLKSMSYMEWLLSSQGPLKLLIRMCYRKSVCYFSQVLHNSCGKGFS